MFGRLSGRLGTGAAAVHRFVNHASLTQRITSTTACVRSFGDVKDEAQPPFDASLLELLVCPLSKKPLRYESKTNELVNEELGIAYPIVDGIPNMIPQEARLIKKDAGDPPTQE